MRIDRRSVLAGALLAAPALRASADGGPIVVVGAGAAGLAAAETLRRAGRTFIVIEARDRIGGRAFTDRALGPDHPFDAGAQYIHWAERNPWTAIASEAGTRIAAEEGWARTLFIDGRPATDAERAERRAGFAGLETLLTAPGPDQSLAEAARSGEARALGAAAGLSRLSLGEEPERVSAQDYARLWSGSDRWVDGYGALVAGHYAHIPVRLGCAAGAIDWSGPGVRVETAAGTITGAAAIVAVPVGVLHAGTIRLTPRLPEATATALAGLGMGAYTKLALRLDLTRFDARSVGDAVAVRGERETLYFEMAPFGRGLAVANLGGDAARDLCRAGEAAAIAAMTDRLAEIFGEKARAAVTGGRMAAWWTDPYARGSYSVAMPGHADAREALRRAIGGRVFLTGEALATGGAMTVGGATLDGERAARAVIAALPA